MDSSEFWLKTLEIFKWPIFWLIVIWFFKKGVTRILKKAKSVKIGDVVLILEKDVEIKKRIKKAKQTRDDVKERESHILYQGDIEDRPLIPTEDDLFLAKISSKIEENKNQILSLLEQNPSQAFVKAWEMFNTIVGKWLTIQTSNKFLLLNELELVYALDRNNFISDKETFNVLRNLANAEKSILKGQEARDGECQIGVNFLLDSIEALCIYGLKI
jgi:hypothetical protein